MPTSGMQGSEQTWIALLRGINVGAGTKILMGELREACSGLGWNNVKTYIQSGNVIFSSPADAQADTLAAELSETVEQRFNIAVPVIVRSASAWLDYVNTIPFKAEAENEPSKVLLAVSERPPSTAAPGALAERAAAGERVGMAGDALWIYFPNGIARSKLTPRLLDRLAGSPVTTRNWRTVLKLSEMAGNISP